MAYVEVDIDLSLIELDELIEELGKRINRSIKRATPAQRDEIREKYALLAELINPGAEYFEIKSLDDNLKIEHLIKIFNNYTVSDLQTLLPE